MGEDQKEVFFKAESDLVFCPPHGSGRDVPQDQRCGSHTADDAPFEHGSHHRIP
jgi:hypothetical protein